MDERLGRWNFWTMFVGFNLGFLPMHLVGLFGMPRRVYTYDAGLGFSALNMVITIGSFLFAVGVLLFFVNVLRSWRGGASAGPDPWQGPTLEWATPSPPPPYNFAVIPTIASRHPLWEDQLGEGDRRSTIEEGMVLDHGKEALAVSVLDAKPNRILRMPEDTSAPFCLALAATVLFTGLLVHLWWLGAIGGLGVAAALVAWTRPRRELLEREPGAHRERGDG
jgi:hypothetical protein